jgi:NAD(P)-dependent dehydrogenase (short-subunit alcohol dehydrogenase family)
MDIRGRVVLVTGAGSGIGRATALAFARAGAAAVAVLDLDREAAEAVAAAVEVVGPRAAAWVVDVGDPALLARAFANVAERFGPLDIVHNNAGIVGGEPEWPDTPAERVSAMIAVNLGGVIHGTRLACDAMRGRGGAVVNTSSTTALNPLPFDAVYAATKAGILHFTRSCAAMAANLGVRVNAVCPGITDTPIIAKTGDGTHPAPWLSGALATRPMASPEDVAAAVVALAVDDTKAGDYVIVEGKPRDEV